MVTDIPMTPNPAPEYGDVATSVRQYRITGRGAHNSGYRHQLIRWDFTGTITEGREKNGLSFSALDSMLTSHPPTGPAPVVEDLRIGDHVTVDGAEYVVTARFLDDPALVPVVPVEEALAGFVPTDDDDTTEAALRNLVGPYGLSLDRKEEWNGWKVIDPVDGRATEAPIASVHVDHGHDAYLIEFHRNPVPDREGKLQSAHPGSNREEPHAVNSRNVVSTNASPDVSDEYSDQVRELLDATGVTVDVARETYSCDEIGRKEYHVRVVSYERPDGTGETVDAVDYEDPASREVTEYGDEAEAHAAYEDLVRAAAAAQQADPDPFDFSDVPGVPARETPDGRNPAYITAETRVRYLENEDDAHQAAEDWITEARGEGIDVLLLSCEVDDPKTVAAIVRANDRLYQLTVIDNFVSAMELAGVTVTVADGPQDSPNSWEVTVPAEMPRAAPEEAFNWLESVGFGTVRDRRVWVTLQHQDPAGIGKLVSRRYY